MNGYWSTLAVVVLGVIAASAVVVVVLAVSLLRRCGAVHRSGASIAIRWVYWGALAYTAFPWDWWAEPVLFDDIGALAVALLVVSTRTRWERRAESRAQGT